MEEEVGRVGEKCPQNSPNYISKKNPEGGGEKRKKEGEEGRRKEIGERKDRKREEGGGCIRELGRGRVKKGEKL